MGQEYRVEGQVRFPEVGGPKGVWTVVVQVEDISRADAPSQVVGETKFQVTGRLSGTVPFEVRVPAAVIQERNSYSVRVHVRTSDSSDRFQKGDLISTQSYPVLTRGSGHRVDVEVRRI